MYRSKRINFMMSPKEKRVLDEIAKRTALPIADVVRQAIHHRAIELKIIPAVTTSARG